MVADLPRQPGACRVPAVILSLVTSRFTTRLGSPWQLATPFPQTPKHSRRAFSALNKPTEPPWTAAALARYTSAIFEPIEPPQSLQIPPGNLPSRIPTPREGVLEAALVDTPDGRHDSRYPAQHTARCDGARPQTQAPSRATPIPPPTIHPHQFRNMRITSTARLRHR